MKLPQRSNNRGGLGERQPSIIATISIDNPRFKEVKLDTSKSVPTIEGVFSIDVTNTGVLSTRATRVTNVKITVLKDNASFIIGEVNEPQRIKSIPGGETRTINVEFSREDTFIKSISDDVCNKNKVNTDIVFTISEILLAATYKNQVELEIESPECRTITIDLSGRSEVNINQEYEWEVITQGGDNIGSVQWDMGDGTVKTGKSVRHTYNDTGDYTISVETSEGFTASKEVTATIVPIGIVGPTDVIVGESSSWSATGQNVDNAGGLTWNTGDGSVYDGKDISHTYDSTGDYSMQLTSGSGGSDEIEINVTFPDITIDNISTPDTIQTNQDNQFSVTGNNLSDANTIRWDMGDGTVLNGQQVTHRYATSGEYTVTVDTIVADESAESSSTDITVETFVL